MTNASLPNIKRGMYRNRLGAELEVVRPFGGTRSGDGFLTLHDGAIWLAVSRDRLIGPTWYLATAEGLAAASYEPVGSAAVAEETS